MSDTSLIGWSATLFCLVSAVYTILIGSWRMRAATTRSRGIGNILSGLIMLVMTAILFVNTTGGILTSLGFVASVSIILLILVIDTVLARTAASPDDNP